MNATRYKFVLFVISSLFIIALIKSFDIAVVHHKYYISQYTKNVFRVSKQKGKRGAIYDLSGDIYAIDYPTYSIFVDPNYFFKDIEFHMKHDRMKDYKQKVGDFIKRLSNFINIAPSTLQNIIDKNRQKHFIVLKRGISLKEFKLFTKGFMPSSFGFIKKYKRYYPDGEYSAHDIGFCFSNGNGAEGLEKYYNAYLKAFSEKNIVPIDAYKYKNIQIPIDGDNLYISLNRDIQDFVHINLKKTVEEHKAQSAAVIVMNPQNGAVIAMDSYPFYNNNRYYEFKYKDIRNRAVADVFEPGSVFKLVTMSAALDSGIFKGNEILYCENGRWRLKNKIIHDAHRFKWLSFDNVFVHSSNIGSAKIALKMGKKVFYRYLIKYGFGKKTGIDTISESKGLVKDIFRVGDIDLANMAFGQGIGVTEIQLARAYSVIANGGYLVRPHFMKFIKKGDRYAAKYEVKKQRILKSSTVKRIKKILYSVVERGTGKKAAVKGYCVAGKTGTAQVPKKGSYKSKEYVASFVGFAPVNTPRIVVAVSVFNPQKGGFYGGTVAAPLFSKIVNFALHYYGIKPTK